MYPQPELLYTYFCHYKQLQDLVLHSAGVITVTGVRSYHAGVLNANEL